MHKSSVVSKVPFSLLLLALPYAFAYTATTEPHSLVKEQSDTNDIETLGKWGRGGKDRGGKGRRGGGGGGGGGGDKTVPTCEGSQLQELIGGMSSSCQSSMMNALKGADLEDSVKCPCFLEIPKKTAKGLKCKAKAEDDETLWKTYKGCEKQDRRRRRRNSGESKCENHGYSRDQCNAVGCCEYDDGECWSAVGPGPCGKGDNDGGNGGDNDNGASVTLSQQHMACIQNTDLATFKGNALPEQCLDAAIQANCAAFMFSSEDAQAKACKCCDAYEVHGYIPQQDMYPSNLWNVYEVHDSEDA